jgi:hypothetical protein
VESRPPARLGDAPLLLADSVGAVVHAGALTLPEAAGRYGERCGVLAASPGGRGEAAMASRHERGATNIGCALSLLVLAMAIVVLVKAVPVIIAVGELTDFAERQVQMASLPRHTDEEIAAAVLYKAQQLHIPLGEEQLKVWRDNREAHLTAKFTVPIAVPFYTYEWKVERVFDRPLF